MRNLYYLIFQTIFPVAVTYQQQNKKTKMEKEFTAIQTVRKGPFYDVTSSMLMFKNNETAAMFVSQTSPVGAELVFLRKRFPLS